MIYIILSAFTCGIYLYAWFQGVDIPAYQAFIWCFIVLCYDIANYRSFNENQPRL